MRKAVRILIVDDDRMTREATRLALTARGYVVSIAENGQSALEAARAGKFDAAIVDLFMPDMDGLQVIAAIHAIDPILPLIAASGFMFREGACPQMPNFDAMAAEAGAKASLYKPFRPDALVKKITEAIEAAPGSFVPASA
jgi:CheY-like chemotaxis protein